jgi:hypothetical protein
MQLIHRPRVRARNPRSPSESPSPSPARAICRGSGVDPRSPGPDPRFAGDWGSNPHPHPRFAGDRGPGSESTPIPIPAGDLPESGIQLSTVECCKGVEFRLPGPQSSLIFEGRQCPMTPLTTAAAAATRVITGRSPPGSQLERNRAFWRMTRIGRVCDATSSPATAPRRAVPLAAPPQAVTLWTLQCFLPRVMTRTATEARRGLILLPIKCSCSAHRDSSDFGPS